MQASPCPTIGRSRSPLQQLTRVTRKCRMCRSVTRRPDRDRRCPVLPLGSLPVTAMPRSTNTGNTARLPGTACTPPIRKIKGRSTDRAEGRIRLGEVLLAASRRAGQAKGPTGCNQQQAPLQGRNVVAGRGQLAHCWPCRGNSRGRRRCGRDRRLSRWRGGSRRATERLPVGIYAPGRVARDSHLVEAQKGQQ